jgi:predicted MFS family arabinose efflux permease
VERTISGRRRVATVRPRHLARLPADFWRLWTAATVSGAGDGVRLAALPLLAASLTRDPRSVSLVAAAGGLPWLLFALPAGALADRWDRKRVLWGVDLTRAAVVAALAAAVAGGHVSVPLLAAVEFALGTAETLFESAAQAAVPAVVPTERLERANGRLYAGTVVASSLAGPPLGSALFAVVAAAPFGFDATSFVLAAALALGLRADLRAPAEQAPAGRLRGQIVEGVRWLWRQRQLRTICLLLTLWNLVENAILAVVVLWALEVLRLPGAAFGLLLAGFAAGGLLGSLLAERVAGAAGPGRGMAACVWVTVAAYLGLGATRSGVVAFALLAVVGAAAFVWNVLSASFRQAVVPAGLQGRISSVYRFATWGVIPAGAALGGVLAGQLGLRVPFLVAAAALAAAGAALLPGLRDADLAAARAEAAAR